MAGPRHPRMMSVQDWRDATESVGAQLHQRWQVFALCEGCGLEIVVSLERVARAKGPSFSLWDKRRPCPRRHCTGQMDFYGQPRGADAPFRMFTAGR
jgi:hypothetical protein